MENLIAELNKMDVTYGCLNLVRSKDGVTVARVQIENKSYIIKYFEREEFKREIENYKILSSLQIPTIRVIAMTDAAILMEDIDASPVYRLGMEQDLSDVEIAKCIAQWYRQLHQKGYSYVEQCGQNLYDESEYFTIENIEFIKKKTHSEDATGWKYLRENFERIKQALYNAKRTLTYNDFYCTNLIVAKDRSSALMFDYNLMGKGYAYADLRNVTSSLSPDAAEAFLTEYGEFSQEEKVLDDVVSAVVTLYLACQREEFPDWARESLEKVRNLT